ncbi:sphingosine-1-phosphate phosphatase 1 [Orussus abietinus]|uniref:sphingosine-1-phosphate phosphatase 1 n=1 Tax=Orussus abietinus TaxID=222816 RepID=UPI00062610D0|nr:sphingosine-1-phosphate phosphatase 1 [Orussus abietinus]XP_012270521.1 sphingosine-1-phosphate phosphatase 1 [Orussus abietinus]
MLLETIEYLKDPWRVARIQEFFGVRSNVGETSASIKNKAQSIVEKCENDNLNLCINETDLKENKGRYVYDTHTNSINGRIKASTVRNRKEGYASSEEETISTSDSDQPNFLITNHFWYYLFLFGTELGDEIFYSSFIPFWFWNIDGAVGRRVVLVWAIIMTIGQTLKDIICWPRPACPPAYRLQQKWSQEYGMPSTHAMISVSIPFSVVLFTTNRYIYPFPIGFVVATLWCTLVCMSRLYLGMHTVLDVIVGLILAILLMVPLVPLVDAADYYFLTKDWALAILIAISIATVVYYPCCDKWTPTRGDTTMVVAVTTGVHVGAWLNYRTGALSTPLQPPPYNIIWPSYSMLGNTILRTVLGFCCVMATKALCKSLGYATMCAILRVNSKELMKSQDCLENRNKVLVDLVYKYIACFMIGFNTVYLLPNVFTMIGIERPTFYTEM